MWGHTALGQCPVVSQRDSHSSSWGHTPDKMTGMGKNPSMVCSHLHQARLGVISQYLGVLLPQNREHLPCITRCPSLLPPAGLDQGTTQHCDPLVPSGISAHPKALLNPGSKETGLGCVWQAEGTPGHLLWVMEMGCVCALGHHRVGCSQPEGEGEELCVSNCV